MITLIIPTYNEASILEKNLAIIEKQLSNVAKSLKEGYEIIIVEESNDETPVIAEKLARKNRHVRHLHSDKRLGKGGAIELGTKAAKGEKVAFLDLDLATGLDSLEPLIKNLDNYDIVIGSRYLPSSRIDRVPLRLFLSKVYSILTRLILRLEPRDLQCGFKAFRKGVALKIFPYIEHKWFYWDTEFLMYAVKLGYSIKEIPIRWHETKENITTAFMGIRNFIRFFRRRYQEPRMA